MILFAKEKLAISIKHAFFISIFPIVVLHLQNYGYYIIM